MILLPTIQTDAGPKTFSMRHFHGVNGSIRHPDLLLLVMNGRAVIDKRKNKCGWEVCGNLIMAKNSLEVTVVLFYEL